MRYPTPPCSNSLHPLYAPPDAPANATAQAGGRTAPVILIPPVPALAVGNTGGVLLTPDGELHPIDKGANAQQQLRSETPMLCHGPATAARLGLSEGRLAGFDVLSLFAFVEPARFCTPTPRGLAESLHLPPPRNLEDAAALLPQVVALLLRRLAGLTPVQQDRLRGMAFAMAQAGWPWGRSVLAVLDPRGSGPQAGDVKRVLNVWTALPEIGEHVPEPPSGHIPVDPQETRDQLSRLLGAQAEDRPQQADYATAVASAFQPRARQDSPEMVLAEAGTGVGKTLGYIAPASVWAERNEGAVWISTFTRNLQRQLDGELDRLYPDPMEKARRVVVRKGRENYLCLLNFEEAVGRAGTTLQGDAAVIGLALTARWVQATRDGDMHGGDFPGWLVDLIGREQSIALTDRRGECVFSGCAHYDRCFVERAVRRARRARVVVANHALVIVQAALGGLDDETRPTRYVFDEGHHVFDAADGAFSAHLSGAETLELRRWLLGGEADPGGRSRARGLQKRCDGLFDADGNEALLIREITRTAKALPAPGWLARLRDDTPNGPVEALLHAVHTQVMARARGVDGPHSLETDTRPPLPEVLEAANAVEQALGHLDAPIKQLLKALEDRLDDAEQAEDIDAQARKRLDGVVRAIERRACLPIAAWRDMIATLSGDPPERFVDWVGIERIDGRPVDVGIHRHWLDPAQPFAETVAKPAHGLVVTSATLRDGSGDVEADWAAAEARSGVPYLPAPAVRTAVASPFDYGARTRVLIVTDVRKDDLGQVSAAYEALFRASGGGALGLFTAVARLRGVRSRLVGAMEAAGIDLYAQHVDAMDVATLIDIFRAEEDACLLGTDAVRDGVDVPGRALRLVVFDRVPWPRPSILHKARRNAFGGRGYDDMLARLKLKQAFGRLVRRADDRGVFVLLDPMMPSRLFGAFPEDVTPDRVGLAEAIAIVRETVGPETA